MKMTVCYTAMFTVEIDVEDDQTVDDAIAGIEIVENDSEYVDYSFNVISVAGPNNYPVDDTTMTGWEISEEMR